MAGLFANKKAVTRFASSEGVITKPPGILTSAPLIKVSDAPADVLPLEPRRSVNDNAQSSLCSINVTPFSLAFFLCSK